MSRMSDVGRAVREHWPAMPLVVLSLGVLPRWPARRIRGAVRLADRGARRRGGRWSDRVAARTPSSGRRSRCSSRPDSASLARRRLRRASCACVDAAPCNAHGGRRGQRRAGRLRGAATPACAGACGSRSKRGERPPALASSRPATCARTQRGVLIDHASITRLARAAAARSVATSGRPRDRPNLRRRRAARARAAHRGPQRARPRGARPLRGRRAGAHSRHRRTACRHHRACHRTRVAARGRAPFARQHSHDRHRRGLRGCHRRADPGGPRGDHAQRVSRQPARAAADVALGDRRAGRGAAARRPARRARRRLPAERRRRHVDDRRGARCATNRRTPPSVARARSRADPRRHDRRDDRLGADRRVGVRPDQPRRAAHAISSRRRSSSSRSPCCSSACCSRRSIRSRHCSPTPRIRCSEVSIASRRSPPRRRARRFSSRPLRLAPRSPPCCRRRSSSPARHATGARRRPSRPSPP